MRKISIWAVAVLLVVALAVSVLAADLSISVSASKTTVNRGDSIVVTVSVDESVSCVSGLLSIGFDNSVFTRSDNKWLVSDTTYAEASGDAAFMFSETKSILGKIFQFSLTAKSEAVFGAYPVNVTLILRDSSGNSYSVSQKITVTVECKHTYGEGVVTKAATCTTDGVRSYTCTQKDCSYTKTEVISATGHNMDSGTVTTAATCTTDGVKTFYCKNTGCNHSTTEVVKATGHSYDSGKVTTEPTCTTAGVKTYTCTHSGCGNSKTDSIAATGHSYDNECDADCNTCGAMRSVEHDYSTVWHSDENGHWHECTICGDALEMELHTPGPEATETTDQICTTCGYVIEKAKEHTHSAIGDWLSDETGHWHLCGCGEIMDADDHLWGAGILNEEKGVMVYTCTECGYSREETAEPGTEPTDGTDPTQGSSNTTPGNNDPGDENTGGMMWLLIVLCIIGVALLGAIIFVVIGIVVSKKQTGRFTGKK